MECQLSAPEDPAVRSVGFEPTTPYLEGRCSSRLSYGRLESSTGIEPATSALARRRSDQVELRRHWGSVRNGVWFRNRRQPSGDVDATPDGCR